MPNPTDFCSCGHRAVDHMFYDEDYEVVDVGDVCFGSDDCNCERFMEPLAAALEGKFGGWEP